MSGEILLALRAGMALLLYAFLGWALLLLVRDLRQESKKISAKGQAHITLVQEAHPDALQHKYNQTEVLIGRDPVCDLVINDSTVSTQHAQLSYHHNQWWVEDLGSKNGTLLNGEPVKASIVLTAEDRISCGNITLQVLSIKDQDKEAHS